MDQYPFYKILCICGLFPLTRDYAPYTLCAQDAEANVLIVFSAFFFCFLAPFFFQDPSQKSKGTAVLNFPIFFHLFE